MDFFIAISQYTGMGGNLLKQIRENQGVTQEQIAEFVGVSIPQISRFEMRQAIPRVHELVRIGKRLNVRPAISLVSDRSSAPN